MWLAQSLAESRTNRELDSNIEESTKENSSEFSNDASYELYDSVKLMRLGEEDHTLERYLIFI